MPCFQEGEVSPMNHLDKPFDCYKELYHYNLHLTERTINVKETISEPALFERSKSNRVGKVAPNVEFRAIYQERAHRITANQQKEEEGVKL